MAENINGTVREIIFSNDENGYTVCELASGDETFVVVGYLPSVAAGDSVSVTGNWSFHPEYGQQFKAETFSHSMPDGVNNIMLFLSSGAIVGIKAATAKKIVARFGEKTLEVIRDTPELLSEIKGITDAKAVKIHESFIERISMQKIVSFFSGYGISASFACKVHKFFGDDAVEKIQTNPYILCEIDGIGFKTADRIAQMMGIDPFAPARIDAAVIYCLSEAATSGHTYLPLEPLIGAAEQMIGISDETARGSIIRLVTENKIRATVFPDGSDGFYLPAYYTAEYGAAKIINELIRLKPKKYPNNIDNDISAIETDDFKFADMQKKAIEYALTQSAVIITGGPGTGKTSVINAIIKLMKKQGLSVALCAPTGRAAKRMSELCGEEAKTLHRLLEQSYSDKNGKLVFGRNSANPIDADAVIIDEMSMVDITLMYHLLVALGRGCRLVMVGDSDQLPSVGAGNVLRDLIDSGRIKTVCLKEIFRQTKESKIVVNAHNINAGKMPEFDNKNDDFFFLHRHSPADGINEITGLYLNRLPKFLGVDALDGIQVLSPSRRGETGVENLNRILQEAFNPPAEDKDEIKRANRVLRCGDKVMQSKNNYDIEWQTDDGTMGSGIFNGDIGIIESIDKKSGLVNILFDNEKHVAYPVENLDEIELAYAVTVHKSQGSEFAAVIMVMYPSHRNLMNRNLLYTAVTRAKKLVVMVGRDDVLKFMVDNDYEAVRYSGLCKILLK